jgi:ribonuclease HII
MESCKNKYGVSYRYSVGETITENTIEIGIDEAGRGPLFGPLFVAAVILPSPKRELPLAKDKDSFDFSEMRDSKKITSKKKIAALAEYIKSNSLAWTIQSVSAEEIDRINIRQAVLKAMRECARTLISQLMESESASYRIDDFFLLVDGNDFPPYLYFDETTDALKPVRHETVAGGDNLYASIACASILAKTARDAYILELCERNPDLKTRYRIDQNMGYGTKHHLEGIEKYGITDEHRKTYGRCNTAAIQSPSAI